ncbi:hypothetical protein XH88_08765 [Bradyrhizobium sp. CCBAU 51627]|nr:hypothetical protein [Bradyrhizobium sp. CCBAU 51627]
MIIQPGLPLDQPLAQNIEWGRAASEALHTSRQLRAAAIIDSQMLLNDFDARLTVRLAGN